MKELRRGLPPSLATALLIAACGGEKNSKPVELTSNQPPSYEEPTPTPTPPIQTSEVETTNNWPVFKNDFFQVSYPEGWETIAPPYFLPGAVGFKSGNNPSDIRVGLTPTPVNNKFLTLDEFKDGIVAKEIADRGSYRVTPNQYIKGARGWRIDVKAGAYHSGRYDDKIIYMLEKGKFLYAITLEAPRSELPEASSKFNTMLASLQFLQ